LGALAVISFSRARYVFDFDDVVGTLIYSTIRIVSLHKPEKRRRPRPHSGTCCQNATAEILQLHKQPSFLSL